MRSSSNNSANNHLTDKLVAAIKLSKTVYMQVHNITTPSRHLFIDTGVRCRVWGQRNKRQLLEKYKAIYNELNKKNLSVILWVSTCDISGSYYFGYMVAVIISKFPNCLEIQIHFNAWHFMIAMAVIMIHTRHNECFSDTVSIREDYL